MSKINDEEIPITVGVRPLDDFIIHLRQTPSNDINQRQSNI